MKKKMKWGCGCGEEFLTKKECEQHVKRVHGAQIRETAGLASLRYHCKKLSLQSTPPKIDFPPPKMDLPTIKTPFVTRKEIDEYFKKKGFV